MAFYSSCPICTTPLFLCLTVASFQLYLVIGYNGVIFQIRYILANRWRNLWSFLINVIHTSVGLPFISWWFMIHIDGNSKLTGQTIWKIPTLIPLITLLKDTNQLSALGAKWKFWVFCSEVFENFKMATAEHSTKGDPYKYGTLYNCVDCLSMKPALVCDVGVLNAFKSFNVDDSQFRLYIEPLQTSNTFISILLSTKQVLAILGRQWHPGVSYLRSVNTFRNVTSSSLFSAEKVRCIPASKQWPHPASYNCPSGWCFRLSICSPLLQVHLLKLIPQCDNI